MLGRRTHTKEASTSGPPFFATTPALSTGQSWEAGVRRPLALSIFCNYGAERKENQPGSGPWKVEMVGVREQTDANANTHPHTHDPGTNRLLLEGMHNFMYAQVL